MTASNFYSLAIFLHASDFPEQKINEEILAIKDIMEITEDEEGKIRSMWNDRTAWVRRLPDQIREARKEIDKNKKDIIRNMIAEFEQNK